MCLRLLRPISKRVAAFLADNIRADGSARDPDFDVRGKAVLELGAGPG